MTEWEEDCLYWRGSILMGTFCHYCPDWDDLPLDETCPEWTDGVTDNPDDHEFTECPWCGFKPEAS